jgi:hypothetical protein
LQRLQAAKTLKEQNFKLPASEPGKLLPALLSARDHVLHAGVCSFSICKAQN